MTKQEQIDWLLERMNDAVDRWHKLPSEDQDLFPTLEKYLGLSYEGYCLYVHYPKAFAARLLGLEEE